MADFTWPDYLVPSQMEFWLEGNTSEFVSPYTRASRVYERPGARWRLRLQFGNLNATLTARMDAFLAALRGRFRTVEIPDFRRLNPAGTALTFLDIPGFGNITEYTDGTRFTDGTAFEEGITGNAQVAISGQLGTRLLTNGWQPSQDTVLKAGDYLQVGTKLYMVIEDAASDISGFAFVSIAPPITVGLAPAAGTQLIIKPARGVFRMEDDSQPRNPTRSPVIATYNLSFVEDLNG